MNLRRLQPLAPMRLQLLAAEARSRLVEAEAEAEEPERPARAQVAPAVSL